MHPYIPHLISDIKAAERPDGPIEKIISGQTFEEEMDFDYCSGYAPDCVFGKYCSCLDYWNKQSAE